MTWVRSGGCCRCGQCCWGEPFPPDDDNPRRSELMRTRKPERPGACPLLIFHGADTACAGHGTDPFYLSGCNVWPDHPIQIANYDRCTFSFEWRDD